MAEIRRRCWRASMGNCLAVAAAALSSACSAPAEASKPLAAIEVRLDTDTLLVPRVGNASATLRDADGNQLAVQPVVWELSDSGVATIRTLGVDAVELRSVAAGQTQVRARVNGVSGSALLTVIRQCAFNDPAVARAIPTNGQALSGTLTGTDCWFAGSYFDLYMITLAGPGQVQVDVTSRDFDALAVVFTSGSVLAARDEDSGEGTDARISVDLAAGTYFVLASAQGGDLFGAYTVSVVERPSQ